MNSMTTPPHPFSVGTLLRGELAVLRVWTAEWAPAESIARCRLDHAGAGCFGAAIGWWRDPLQALYAGISYRSSCS